MSTTKRLYPGMCDDGLELFFHEEEGAMKAIIQGKVVDFADLTSSEIQFLIEILETEPGTTAVLRQMCGTDVQTMLEKLARCRFGGLNFQADFSPSSNAASADAVDCIIRKSCPGCGIVCRNIVHNGEELSHTDIRAIQLMASDYKNEVVAEKLNMPLGSFHVYRTNLYKRSGVKSKPELASVGVQLGLI